MLGGLLNSELELSHPRQATPNNKLLDKLEKPVTCRCGTILPEQTKHVD